MKLNYPEPGSYMDVTFQSSFSESIRWNLPYAPINLERILFQSSFSESIRWNFTILYSLFPIRYHFNPHFLSLFDETPIKKSFDMDNVISILIFWVYSMKQRPFDKSIRKNNISILIFWVYSMKPLPISTSWYSLIISILIFWVYSMKQQKMR